MKFLFLTNHTFGGPWIHKTQVFVKFARPESYLNTIFKLITNKAKQVEPLMLCHVFFQ